MNIEHLKAGYLLNQLVVYFPHIWSNALHTLSIFFSYFLPLVLLTIIFYIIRKIYIRNRFLKKETVLLEITPPAISQKTAYTTQQLFSVMHDLGEKRSFINWLLGEKNIFSFEIVSTRHEGIRYIIRTTAEQENSVQKHLLSYLPQVMIKTVEDYISQDTVSEKLYRKVMEFKIKKRFAYPLQKQNILKEHDPVAYITGIMTKLSEDEIISFQIVLSPTRVREVKKLISMIFHNEDILQYLDRRQYPFILKPFMLLGKAFAILGNQCAWAITEFMNGSNKEYVAYERLRLQTQMLQTTSKPIRVFTEFEKEIITSIKEKIDQPLFEASVRFFVMVKNKEDLQERTTGFISSLANFSIPNYQALISKRDFPGFIWNSIRFFLFKKRLLSLVNNSSSSLLSVSEIADLYHFPFLRVTQTENIIKVHSKQLPAPLSLKKGKKFDVIFANNIYGGVKTSIGLTDEDRAKHIFLLGQTGSGKTTNMFHMARHDILQNRGVAIVDPHGDLAVDLRNCIPDKRKNDFIYLDPFDLEHSVAINLLELTEGLTGTALKLEQELVCEGVISIFRRVFSDNEQANAHRIESMLRNTIYTAFTLPERTIFTVFDLLNNPTFQKKVTKNIKDKRLQDFWNNEFGRAGNYQIVKMVSGVTARIGRFLFSPTAQAILDHTKSTINFDQILQDGKILICNLSEGNLGEDTSRILGTAIITKIHQAALKRTRIESNERKPFYLFVDEFQNFATTSFTRMLSGGRKFGLRITIAEQTTAQQADRNSVNVILANTGTVMCFRTASPIDEELMLDQFSPYITKGEIMNLPEFHFYIKMSATNPEEPFSGETIPIEIKKDKEKIARLMDTYWKNYTIPYDSEKNEKKEEKIAGEVIEEKPETKSKIEDNEGMPDGKES